MVESSSRRGGQPLRVMHRFVLETLRAFAAEDVAHQIVEAALHAAREVEVPEEGERLRRFVERHLPEAVRKDLGATVGEAVTEALRPIARMFPGEADTSHVRTRRQRTEPPSAVATTARSSDRPSLAWSASPPGVRARPPEEPETHAKRAASGHRPESGEAISERATAIPPELALPIVILATRNETREAEIRRWLGDRAALTVARDAVHLLECVEIAMNLAPVLLIDCAYPAVRLPTLLMLGDDLPTGATVVLWGVPENETFDEFALSRGAARFIRCGLEADARDVGTLINPFITR